MSSPRLFISNCPADQARVFRLREALEARGVATWADRVELNLGDDLARVKHELLARDGVVQVVSAAAMESDWVKKERGWDLKALYHYVKHVASAKARWQIERDDRELKTEFGLDKYQGRGWRGFHHHWTLFEPAWFFGGIWARTRTV